MFILIGYLILSLLMQFMKIASDEILVDSTIIF